MNYSFDRLRTSLVAIFLAGLSLSCFSQSNSLKVQYYPGVAFSVTFYVAMAEGLFKKHGVDVETVGVTSGPAALAALSGGSVEIAAVNPDLLVAARQRGLDFKGICAASGPYFELVGASGFARKPYPEVMQQISGKNIGVNALGSGGQFFMEAMLEGAGMSKESVTYIPVGPVAAVEAMQNKRVDFYMSFEPMTTFLTQSGNGKLLWSLADAEGPTALTKLRVGIVWIAQGGALEKEPAKYLAFNRALEEAKAFVSDPVNADKVAGDVLKLAGVNTKGLAGGDETMREVIKKKLLRVNAITRFDTNEVDQWLTYMAQYQNSMLKPSSASAASGQALSQKTVWASGCK
ncbi:ABC transporter substrate-binding protein [Variovorax sp. PBL-E5]|uniref:ABC transporter substrate-binding protein n=1 Tax=Variovorax sp. PBL-E5 TaxID=434014 RepID=UPI0013178975|nr:ABC transporter substrate-binding protein [Variovorax sp. PBL-E5]VTU34440.1 Putative aliphatic sulfonates-binding protein precursor [Variovorax sp. PBL-E5]